MTKFADLPSLTPDNVEQLVICGYRVRVITGGDGQRAVGLALMRAEDPGAKPWFLILPPATASDLGMVLLQAAIKASSTPLPEAAL